MVEFKKHLKNIGTFGLFQRFNDFRLFFTWLLKLKEEQFKFLRLDSRAEFATEIPI
jgi:hypothetical protein